MDPDPSWRSKTSSTDSVFSIIFKKSERPTENFTRLSV